MKYTAIEKNKVFIREEKKTNVVLLKDTTQQFLLNSVGLKMLKAILENDDDADVLKLILEQYPMAEKDVISRDLKDLIRLLRVFDIICYEDEMEEKSQGSGISAIDENDYNTIEKFIEANRQHSCFIGAKKGYYIPQNVRTHVMNNSEYYFASQKDSQTKAIVSFVPNKENSVMLLSTLAFEKDLLEDEMLQMWKEVSEHAVRKTSEKTNKIRWSFYSKNGDEPVALTFLKKIGFKKEAILLKELNDFDMHIYSLYV